MSVLVPTSFRATSYERTITNDGWFPNVDLAEFRSQTGLGDTFGPDRMAAAVQAAILEVNAGVRAWRSAQTAACLDQVPEQTSYGGVPEKVLFYKRAVYARARAELLLTTRDFDSTKSGHGRADDLESTARDHLRHAAEATARLCGQPRIVVELI